MKGGWGFCTARMAGGLYDVNSCEFAEGLRKSV